MNPKTQPQISETLQPSTANVQAFLNGEFAEAPITVQPGNILYGIDVHGAEAFLKSQANSSRNVSHPSNIDHKMHNLLDLIKNHQIKLFEDGTIRIVDANDLNRQLAVIVLKEPHLGIDLVKELAINTANKEDHSIQAQLIKHSDRPEEVSAIAKDLVGILNNSIVISNNDEKGYLATSFYKDQDSGHIIDIEDKYDNSEIKHKQIENLRFYLGNKSELVASDGNLKTSLEIAERRYNEIFKKINGELAALTERKEVLHKMFGSIALNAIVSEKLQAQMAIIDGQIASANKALGLSTPKPAESATLEAEPVKTSVTLSPKDVILPTQVSSENELNKADNLGREAEEAGMTNQPVDVVRADVNPTTIEVSSNSAPTGITPQPELPAPFVLVGGAPEQEVTATLPELPIASNIPPTIPPASELINPEQRENHLPVLPESPSTDTEESKQTGDPLTKTPLANSSSAVPPIARELEPASATHIIDQIHVQTVLPLAGYQISKGDWIYVSGSMYDVEDIDFSAEKIKLSLIEHKPSDRDLKFESMLETVNDSLVAEEMSEAEKIKTDLDENESTVRELKLELTFEQLKQSLIDQDLEYFIWNDPLKPFPYRAEDFPETDEQPFIIVLDQEVEPGALFSRLNEDGIREGFILIDLDSKYAYLEASVKSPDDLNLPPEYFRTPRNLLESLLAENFFDQEKSSWQYENLEEAELESEEQEPTESDNQAESTFSFKNIFKAEFWRRKRK